MRPYRFFSISTTLSLPLCTHYLRFFHHTLSGPECWSFIHSRHARIFVATVKPKNMIIILLKHTHPRVRLSPGLSSLTGYSETPCLLSTRSTIYLSIPLTNCFPSVPPSWCPIGWVSPRYLPLPPQSIVATTLWASS